MANIAQNAELPSNPTAWVQYPVANGVQIYASAHVMLVAGYLYNAADTSGGVYVGQALNDALGNAALTVTCNVARVGSIVTVSAVSPSVASWVGLLVAFTDNQTVNLNASTSNHVVCGRVTQIVETGSSGLIKVDTAQQCAKPTTNA